MSVVFTPEQREVLQAAGAVYRAVYPLLGAERARIRETAPQLADALDRLEEAVHGFAASEAVRDIRPEDFESGGDR